MWKKTKGSAVLAIVCSAAMIGMCGLKTSAAPALNSRGNFIADGGKVVFCDTDSVYLNNELDSLENEIDDIVFDMSDIREALNPRRNDLRSGGIINYDNGKVVIDAMDLIRIADRIDRLENNYVSSAVSALGRIGTYLDRSGNISHSEASDGNSVLYACDRIKEGILQSQDVDYLDGVTSIIADNLTAGTAAWVNGKYVIGNGADNRRAYEKGREAGKAGTGEDIFDMKYVYHQHWGEQTGAGTGCYEGYHDHSDSCYETRYCRGYVTCESISETVDHGCHTSYTVYGYCDTCKRNTHYSIHVSQTDECAHFTDGTTHQYREMICNSPYNAWRLACGKTEGVSHDSVTMIIRKNDTIKAEVDTEMNTKADAEINTEADTEMNIEANVEVKSEVDDEMDTEVDAKVDVEVNTEVEDEVNTEVNNEVKEQEDEE